MSATGTPPRDALEHLHPSGPHRTSLPRLWRRAVTTLRRISEQLQRLENSRLGPRAEGRGLHRRLLEEVELLQRTSALRVTRPEPLDEVRTIMTVFDQT